MSSDFIKEMDNNMKRNSKYLKELLESDKIPLNFEHNSYLENLLKNNKKRFIEEFIDSFEMYLRILNEEKFDKFKKGEISISSSHYCCSECGEHFVYVLNMNGMKPMKFKRLGGASDELEYAPCVKVPKTYSFEIAFPTGEIICDDGLPYSREIFEEIYDYNINSSKGIYDTIIDFAKNNILHVFVGNTCPSVWLKEDKLAIGNMYEEEECNCGADHYKDCNCDYKQAVPLDGEEISSICTDLWWASMVDVQIYKEILIKEFGEEEAIDKLKSIEKVKRKIKPGVYKCTYFSEATSMDYEENPIIYTTMEWIRNI